MTERESSGRFLLTLDVMAKRSPLAVIQQDLLDGTESTTRILQKVVLLGNQIGSTDLADWARKELYGYEHGDELPPYRTIPAVLQLDGWAGYNQVSHKCIGPEDLPKEAREAGIGNEVSLRNGIAELEAFASKSETLSLALPNGTLIAKLMSARLQQPFQGVERVYWAVGPASFHGVVEAIRTALADLVGEMLRVLPSEDETPPKELADQAVNFLNTGKRPTIILNNSQAAGGSTSTATLAPPKPEKAESWLTRWRNRGIFIGAFTVVGGAAAALDWLGIVPGLLPWN